MSIKFIKELIPSKSTPVLMAVSMGVDSLSAFDFLQKGNYNVIPIHFNHGIRPQNDEFQNDFNEAFKTIPNYTKKYAGLKLKTESEYRHARLEFYREACTVYSSKYVITAHHINDWIESYLMNVFRGHPNYVPISLESSFTDFSILHPFLKTEKDDFRVFMEKSKYKRFCNEDETNSVETGSRRNFIRNSIIPLLKQNQISLIKYAIREIDAQIEKYTNTLSV